MAEVVIFEYAKIDNFAFNNQYGMYTSGVPSDAVFEIGKSYTVVWDDVEYTCVGQDMSALVEGAVSVGNLSAFGGIGNDEPFVIASAAGGFLFGSFDTKTDHWVGIVTEIHAPNDVVIQNYSQTEVPYTNVPKVWLKSPNSTPYNLVLVPFSYGEAIENVPISLDFSAGDQRVTAEDGYLVKSAVIEKPGDLAAENVRRGKVIAGVEGDFVGDTEEITVDGDNDLTFAGGDFVVEPSSAEKVISKVTISPPSALVPANIAKGVTIAGVEGTHEGGGGGGGGDIVAEKDVKFFDYDGTLLHEYTIAEANALSELPELPTHDGLICQGWNYSLDEVNAMTLPANIGAIYTTDDGKTRVYVEYTADKANAWSFFWQQSVTNGVVVDWGDGSSAQSAAGTGAVKLSHTYATAGDYMITFDVIDGCTFTLGSGNDYQQFIGTFKYVVKNINIGNGDVRISDHAFYNNYSLQTITIPSNVTSIGNNAFYICSSLKSITIPSSVTNIGNNVFYKCNALKSITIPSGVTGIGDYAFYQCYSLKNITIPNATTSIGKYAFSNCSSLKNVIKQSGAISIGSNAFYQCYSLENVIMPDGITSIGTYACYYCYSLKSISKLSDVASIGNYTFFNCYSLGSITIPDGVTSIGSSAFNGCYSLTSIDIPNSVTSIGNNAFSSCTSLTSINIPDGVTSIGNNAFSGCTSLTSINIPDGVTSIGNNAFSNCTSLTSINIPDGVTSIGSYAFSACSSLSNVSIPSSVTSIDTYTFYQCYSMKNIIIPPSVKSIGNSAFYTCYSLGVVDFSNFTEIPTLGGTNAFYKQNLLTIKVPSSLLSSWKTKTNWSTFASYMVGV